MVSDDAREECLFRNGVVRACVRGTDLIGAIEVVAAPASRLPLALAAHPRISIDCGFTNLVNPSRKGHPHNELLPLRELWIHVVLTLSSRLLLDVDIKLPLCCLAPSSGSGLEAKGKETV